jgi:RNA 2',3'-cyclic 3'-phosphodiesterase
MRLFIAIEIPEDSKKGLAEVQDKIKDSGVDAGWTRPEGIHLTLKFLGEVSEAKVPEIMAALADATKETTGFRLEIADAGAFPNPKNARVVWIGVSGEREKLTRLQAAVEKGMDHIVFKRENRAFTPHLTLGRIKFIRSRDTWLKALDGIKDVKLLGFDARTVCLMKSELKSSGSVYTEIGKVKLK